MKVTRLKMFERPNQPVEGDLLHADGSATPVELILRPVDYGTRTPPIAVLAQGGARDGVLNLGGYRRMASLPG